MSDKECAVVWMLYFVGAAIFLSIGGGLHLTGIPAAVLMGAVLVPLPGLLARFWRSQIAARLELLAAYYSAALFALAIVTIAALAAVGIARRFV
jgi:hypothetical protein